MTPEETGICRHCRTHTYSPMWYSCGIHLAHQLTKLFEHNLTVRILCVLVRATVYLDRKADGVLMKRTQ